ncbi:MAG: DUF4340 domain-containing protein, partial [bacterium]
EGPEGKKGLTLLVGETNSATNRAFAQLEGDKQVFTIFDYVKSNLDKKLFDLRSKTLLEASPDQVTTVTVSSAKGNWEAQKVAEGKWALLTEGKNEADGTAIENLLRDVNTARAVDFVDTDTANLAAFGLDAPAATLRVEKGGEVKDRPAIEGFILIGAEKPGSSQRYAKSSEQNSIALVDKGLLDKIARPTGDFRDKSLFTLTMADVARVESRAGKTHVVLVKDEKGTWRFEDKPKVKVNQYEIINRLSAFASAKAQTWVEDHPSSYAAFGLDIPRVTFIMSDKDGKTTEGLMTGGLDVERNIAYARLLDRPEVLGVPFNLPGRIALTENQLIDKTLLEVAPSEICTLTITEGETFFELKYEDNQWKARPFEGASPRTVEQLPVSSFLNSLVSLKYEDELTSGAVSIEEAELETPETTIVALGRDGSALFTLKKGRPKGNSVVLSLNDKRFLQISNTAWNSFAGNLAKVKSAVTTQF